MKQAKQNEFQKRLQQTRAKRRKRVEKYFKMLDDLHGEGWVMRLKHKCIENGVP